MRPNNPPSSHMNIQLTTLVLTLCMPNNFLFVWDLIRGIPRDAIRVCNGSIFTWDLPDRNLLSPKRPNCACCIWGDRQYLAWQLIFLNESSAFGFNGSVPGQSQLEWVKNCSSHASYTLLFSHLSPGRRAMPSQRDPSGSVPSATTLKLHSHMAQDSKSVNYLN